MKSVDIATGTQSGAGNPTHRISSVPTTSLIKLWWPGNPLNLTT